MITLNVIFQCKDGVSINSDFTSNSIDYPILITKPKKLSYYLNKQFEFLEEIYDIKNSTLTLYYGEI